MKTWLPRVAIASIVIVSLQITIVSPYRIAGIAIMLVWLWPLSVGLLGDQRSGVAAGIASGLLFDAHVATPFGLFAIVGAAVGYVAGLLGQEDLGDLRGAVWWMPLAIGGGFGFVTPVVLVVVGFFFGGTQLWRGDLGATMVVNALAFGFTLRPVVAVSRILVGPITEARR